MGKTIEGENATYVMLLDPETEEPTGGPTNPLHIEGTVAVQEPVEVEGTVDLDDGWTVDAFIDEGANDSSKQWQVPDGRIWHIFWVAIKLATTATAGNRQIEVRVQRSGISMFTVLARCGVVQAASTTYEYTIAPGEPDLTAVRDNVAPSNPWIATPMPVTAILRAGDTLRVWDNKSIAGGADDMSVWVQYGFKEV